MFKLFIFNRKAFIQHFNPVKCCFCNRVTSSVLFQMNTGVKEHHQWLSKGKMCLFNVKQFFVFVFLIEVGMINSLIMMVLVAANFHCWPKQLLLFNKQDHHQKGIMCKKQKLQRLHKTAAPSFTTQNDNAAATSAYCMLNYQIYIIILYFRIISYFTLIPLFIHLMVLILRMLCIF